MELEIKRELEVKSDKDLLLCPPGLYDTGKRETLRNHYDPVTDTFITGPFRLLARVRPDGKIPYGIESFTVRPDGKVIVTQWVQV